MLTNGSKYWLGVVAIFIIDLFVAVTVQAQTPIFSCPYNITTPGAYVVTSNLKSSGTCIGITTDDVAIDLQGHKITGDGANGAGVNCVCNHSIIANGTIEKFDTGIFISGGFNTIANMTAQFNAGPDRGQPGNGIVVVPANVSETLGGVSSVTVVTNSSAIGNTRDGIVCFAGPCSTAIVTGSEAKDNGEIGINGFGIITDSKATGNGVAVNNNPPAGAGIATSGFVAGTVAKNNKSGILMGAYSSVIDSEATGNTADGISLSGGGHPWIGSITNSIAQNNGGRGILLECPVSAFGNKSTNNQGGNLVTSDNTCLLLDNKVK
jgi:hypothetical protein